MHAIHVLQQKKISADEMSGLQPVLYLARDARIMLTMNLWPDVGLCNGATGVVKHIIYQAGHGPPSLPISVMIQFDKYSGPSFSPANSSLVPISPISACASTSHTLERLQLPLRLAWSLTIHKSQGLTLPIAWVDIGKTERTSGVSYVAISRVKTLSSLVLEPMPFERLAKIKLCKDLKFRIEEEERLHKIFCATQDTYTL